MGQSKTAYPLTESNQDHTLLDGIQRMGYSTATVILLPKIYGLNLITRKYQTNPSWGSFSKITEIFIRHCFYNTMELCCCFFPFLFWLGWQWSEMLNRQYWHLRFQDSPNFMGWHYWTIISKSIKVTKPRKN